MKRLFVVMLAVFFATLGMLYAQDEVIAEEPVEEVAEVVEEVVEEVKVKMGHDLVLGLGGGAFVPLGQNVSGLFGVGPAVGLTVEVPKLVDLDGLCISAGLNLGYLMAGADVGDDISAVLVGAFGGLDLSKFMPDKMKLGVELGVAGYFLSRTDSYAGAGINGAVVYGYDLGDMVENLGVLVKLGGHEILTGVSKDVGGTMEWIDVRLGVTYKLPKVLPF